MHPAFFASSSVDHGFQNLVDIFLPFRVLKTIIFFLQSSVEMFDPSEVDAKYDLKGRRRHF